MTQAMPRILRSRRTRLVAATSAAAIVWSLAAAAQAQDLPSNPVIVNSNGVGTAADFTFGANLLTIDQHHDRVVIDWDDFNIGALDTVTFNQPDANAIAFNRVDPSAFTTIDGTLNANGGVWLFSPGGLLFGSGAVVNVGSFVASTATLGDGDIADALGTNSVTLTPGTATGTLTIDAGASITATDGFVVVLGETIVQNGTIVSDTDAAWFGVAQGGEITFTPGVSSGPALDDGTVAGVAGQQPSITQGATGSTTAATWVGVSTPSTVANGWSTLMNLAGTIQASGIKPTTDAGVFIITGDDGVYDLTAVDTVLDSTGGLITANNGDVYIRTGQATLQDVYAEDIDVFTGGDLTLTGAIQATNDIVIGSDTLVSIESTADVDAAIDVTVTTTAAGGDIYVDGDVYGYSSVVMVAHDQLTVDGTIEGVYGVYLFSTDTTAAAGSLITSLNDVYIQADGDAILNGAVYGGAIDIQADDLASVSGILDAGYVNIETSAGDILIANGAQVSGTAGGFAVTMYAHTDLTIEDGATVYSVQNMRLETITGELSIGGYLDGVFIDLYGASGATVSETGYVQGNSIHLRSGGDVFMDGDLYTNNFIGIYSDADITIGQYGSVDAFSINVVADGSLTTEAGSLIDNTQGTGTISLRAYGADGAASAMELSGDIDAHNLQLVTTVGSVAVLDGTITAANDLNGYVGADFVTADPSLVDATGDISLDVTGNIDLAGDINAYSFEAYADGDFTQSGGTITVENGGVFVSVGGDISTDAGASITNEVGSDNVVIELFADNNVYLDGDIHGYEVFVDSVGPMIMIGGAIYATDFIFIYNDTGSLHLTGTADLETGTPVSSSFSSIYLGAYGSVRVDAGAQITAGVGQPGAYVSLYANGPTGYLNMSGDISSGGIYMGARSGDVDVYIGGTLDADGYIFIGATGDLTTGAASSITAGDYIWLSGDASVDVSGDIYAYQVAIYTDGDFTQSAGTITVDDGGLYVYALNDITTEAGALIETTIDGNQGIIYLNAGHDLYLGGDIDGGYFVTINSVGIGNDTILEVSGSIYATDFIILYNDYGDIHLTGTAELFAGQPTTFSEPGIWLAAEGSIITDAGSYIHTYPGYATGYVHIEVNDITGSIDLSGDITTENLTIEAPFGVVDIFLRDGVIDLASNLTIDSNGELLVGATIYADAFYFSAADQLTISGELNANGDVTLNSDTGVTVTSTGQIFGYQISIGTPGVTDIDGDIYGYSITVGGYDGIYISGTLDAQAEVNVISLYGDVAIEDGAYIHGFSFSGDAVYISADGALTMAGDADIIAYGDVQLTGGSLDLDGYVYGYNVSLLADGDITVGSTGVLFSRGVLHMVSEDTPATTADITIGGDISAQYGIYIANHNDGDVIIEAGADIYTQYFMGLRIGPRGGQTSLGGMDGDIYIYSAGSVVTAAGSVIDATQGVGSDQGLVTIIAAGADGPLGVPAAIDLSGDIIAYTVDLQTTTGSIHLRDGDISFTDGFYANSALHFFQDSPNAIDGVSPSDHADVDILADGHIGLSGSIEGYYVDIVSTGSAGAVSADGSFITVTGEIYASDDILIHNLNGDINVYASGIIHTGTPYETSFGDIDLIASQTITTQAGSQIYTSANYGAGSQINLTSYASSGTGIDLAGDISTAGDVNLYTNVNGDILISDGDIYAGGDVSVRSFNEIQITGGLIQAGDTVTLRADSNMLLGGDVYADYITAAIYDGEQGGFPDLRVEGDLIALTDLRITNELGDVVIGAGAVVNGNYSGLADVGNPAVRIFGERILTEAGSLIITGDAGGPPVGSVLLYAQNNFAGAGPTIDLSGDITAEYFDIEAGLTNDVRVRDGDITAISTIDIYTEGYFIIDDPASISSEDNIFLGAGGGMVVDGDLTGDRIYLAGWGVNGLSVNGGLYARENIYLIGGHADVLIGEYAILEADTDDQTLIGENNGIIISAMDQVIVEAGARLSVGPSGSPTGDVSISAHGLDAGGYSSIDLAGDIEAQTLDLYTQQGSIRLRDGDIVLTDDLYIYSPRGFVMDGGATITTPNDVRIYAEYQVTVAGTINSGDDIFLRSLGAIGGGLTVNGYLYADADIVLSSNDADAAIVLGGPTLIADADGTSDGAITVSSAGSVLAPGGGLMQVGDDPDAPTGGVVIAAYGGDANGPAIDLSIDIYASTLSLTADGGSIHLSGGDIDITQTVEIDSDVDFVMDGPATLTSQGDIEITAQNNLFVDGQIFAGGDLTLLIAPYLGQTYFTPDPGDMVITGDVTANGSIIMGNSGGDIYLDGTAYVLANADDAGTDEVYLYTDSQIVTATGSEIRVGTGTVASGNVTLIADGADNADYAAIDLSGNINAAVLTLETSVGSISLQEGTINASLGVTIDSADAFTLEDGVIATTGGNFIVNAAGPMTIDGYINAGYNILLTRSGAANADIVISGDLYAAANIDVTNAGSAGDVILNGAHLISDSDLYGSGSVQLFSNGVVYAYNGGLIASGTVANPSNYVIITANGGDAGGVSAIDLDVDIAASTLIMNVPAGSVDIAGGTITVENPLTITTSVDFSMDGDANINADDDVTITAGRDLTVDGDINAQGAISLTVTGANADDIHIGGQLLADESIFVRNYGDSVYLDGLLIATAFGGSNGDIVVHAAGDLIATGADLIAGNEGVGAAGDILLSANGDIYLGMSTFSVDLEMSGAGDINVAYGQFYATGDVLIEANGLITTGEDATIHVDGDADLLAGAGMDIGGDIYAGGDIRLEIYSGEGLLTAFVADAGDIVISSNLNANGAIYVSAGYYGGDVYLAGAANLLADADSAGSDGLVHILADGQVVSAAGSTITVGAPGAATGDVLIEAFGTDSVDYAAIDIASDIDARNLTLDADAGSIHLAGGTITVTQDLYVESDLDIIQYEPANIYGGGDVYFSAGRVLTVEGAIHADGDIDLLLSGPYAQTLTVDRLLDAGGDVSIVNTDGDVVLGAQTSITAGGDVTLYADGDLDTDGGVDADGAFYAYAVGAMTILSDIETGGPAEFISGGAMILDASITSGPASSVIAQSGSTLDHYGLITAGDDAVLSSAGTMTVYGDIVAQDDINLSVYGGEGGAHLIVGGDLTADGDLTLYNTSGGVVRVNDGATLIADADASGDNDLLIYSDWKVITEAGSILHVGSATERTGFISIHAYGYDGEGGAAIQLYGEMDAESVSINAHNGSVHVGDGSIQADEDVEIYAYEDFIIDDGALIWGAQNRAYQDDISTEVTLPGTPPGVFIVASDVDISGEIRSGTATDDATIVIQALNVDGDVTLGGADNGLSTGFTLSDAEFQNLIANRIVLLAGPAGDGYDLTVANLTLDAANTSDVWLGTTGTISVEGAVVPTQPGAVDLHLGLAILFNSVDVGGLQSLAPGQYLADFIPGDIYITGSLGSVTNPLGQVTLVANGDILMGSSPFIDAAESDPEFDAFEDSEEYDSPGEGHVYIAADILQMAATGVIQQQDTVTGPEFGGLVLGLPQEGLELIFSPDDIQGQPIGGPSGWIADFNAGPERIELFGSFNGSPHAITGPDAALVDHLLDPDILLGDFEFNTCLFGSAVDCRQGGVVPPFQNPTPPVHTDAGIVPPFGDDAVSFFSSFPFQEPDEEEEEERIEGEPVTGSGNEDLWPVTSQGGTRP